MAAVDGEKAEDEFIAGFPDVNHFTKQALRNFMLATKSANELPCAGDDYDYYSSFSAFRDIMDMESSRILQLIQDVMRYHGAKGNLSSTRDTVELADRYDTLVDANDQLLERVGNFLDEASGVKKNDTQLVIASMTPKNPVSGSWNKKSNLGSGGKKSLASYKLLTARNIQRPQLKFKDKIDNSPTPFVPKIKHKPNATAPIPESIMDAQAEDRVHNIQNEDFTGEELGYPHPYQVELDNFNPDVSNIQKVEPQSPIDLETPCPLITTLSDLMKLCDTLKSCSEIAIDLEHHSYRTFQGITCLMQISTRKNDYLIDTLELRTELHILNEVFTDPKIVKVLHGADMDIDWLQRDFGLYIVNLFDTGQASRMLGFPSFSLAYLMGHYCNVNPDKQYQLADWRIRPLPEELVKYAREDTHYLLYIYDRIRNDLVDRGNQQGNLVHSVIQRSKQIAGKVYQKPRLRPDDHLDLYRKSKKVFNVRQLTALREIYAWRDRTARTEDESIGFVLPNHMLLQIAELLPREQGGILACCNPIPPLVRQSLNELHHIVTEAKDLPLQKINEPERKTLEPSRQHHPRYNTLRCPHDTSHDGQPLDTVVAMETSFALEEKKEKKPDLYASSSKSSFALKSKPLLEMFGKNQVTSKSAAQMKAEAILQAFMNPVGKYLPPELAKGQAIAKTSVLTPSAFDTQLDLHPMTMQWKLLPNTAPEVRKPSRKVSAKPQKLVGSDAKIAFNDCEEEEEARPVRNMTMAPWILDAQKRKAEAEGGPEKKKKERPEVEVFDYSQTDFSLLMGGPSTTQQDKQYDPNKMPEHKFQAPSKTKLKPSSGKKSASFGKSKKLGKIQWPKR